MHRLWTREKYQEEAWERKKNVRTHFQQGWAIPGFGQQYYTQYYTGQNYEKLYNTLYQVKSTNFKS